MAGNQPATATAWASPGRWANKAGGHISDPPTPVNYASVGGPSLISNVDVAVANWSQSKWESVLHWLVAYNGNPDLGQSFDGNTTDAWSLKKPYSDNDKRHIYNIYLNTVEQGAAVGTKTGGVPSSGVANPEDPIGSPILGLGKVPNAIGSGVNDLVNAAKSPLDVLKAIGGALTNGNTWLRVGEFAVGGILLAVGAAVIAKNTSAGKTAGHAAKLAAL